jgi:hypothetical protein
MAENRKSICKNGKQWIFISDNETGKYKILMAPVNRQFINSIKRNILKMNALKNYYCLHFITGVSVILCSSCTHGDGKVIPVQSKMIINEAGYGNAMAWFDEQDRTRSPQTAWETPGQKDFWPAAIDIDLGQSFHIQGFWIFDGPKSNFNGSDYEHCSGRLELKTGKPFSWKNQKTYKPVNDSAWHYVQLDVTSGFVQLQKVSTMSYMWNGTGPYQCDPEIREIILCGFPEKQGDSVKPGTPAGALSNQGPDVENKPEKRQIRNSAVTMNEFIGINSYCWSPEYYNSQMGFIREYHHWSINGVLSGDDPICWNIPGRNVNLDLFYMKNQGKVCVDVHRNISEGESGEARPDFGKDPSDPASYELLADFMYQYAARYGKVRVAENKLRNKPGEPVLSGTGWVSYLETWNEPDRWWGKEGEHFTPFQMSAMMSATYDGHLGTIGSDRGGKSADPGIKMVLGGLSSLDTNYISAMKLWSDYNRNGSFPADVISFHHYCNTSGGQGFTAGTKGISPEADDFKGRMQKMVAWRNRNLPGCEIWISEFGWDSSPGSPQAATGHSQFPARITASGLQAVWLIRGYLAGAAAGVDRMCMFMLNDEEGTGLFKSCGLLTTNDVPKISWFYLSAFRNTLKDTYFRKEILSGHPDVWIYQFSNLENTKDIYVLWCPTSDGTTVKDYMFSLSEKTQTAMLVRLSKDNPAGIISPLRFTNNITEVGVSETPVMIVVEKQKLI